MSGERVATVPLSDFADFEISQRGTGIAAGGSSSNDSLLAELDLDAFSPLPPPRTTTTNGPPADASRGAIDDLADFDDF